MHEYLYKYFENIKKREIFFIRCMRPLTGGCGGSFHRLCLCLPKFLAAVISLRVCHVKLSQESRAVARKAHNAAAVLFGLKFADNIHFHTYIHFYLLKNEIKEKNIYKLDNKAASCTYSCPIHFKFNISQPSKARLQSSKHTGAKQTERLKAGSRGRLKIKIDL